MIILESMAQKRSKFDSASSQKYLYLQKDLVVYSGPLSVGASYFYDANNIVGII